MDVSCPDSYVIHIQNANYGRMSLHICNDEGIEYIGIPCMFDESTTIAKEQWVGGESFWLTGYNFTWKTDPFIQ